MRRRLAAAAAVGLVLTFAQGAHAAPFTTGSFAFTAVTPSLTDVTTTTVFPLSPPSVQPNLGVGDFAGVPLPVLLLPAGAVNFNLIDCCNWTDPLIGLFIGTTAPVRTQTTPHPNGSATWNVKGLFTVGNNWDNAGTVLDADMTWSLTQTGGPSSATSISGSFHAPPVVEEAPGPGTLALMGLGFCGFAASRRRK